MRIALWPVLPLALVLGAGDAAGQTQAGPEVFGHAGYARSDDDEGWIGSGVHAGGGLGYRLSRRWSVQAAFDVIHHERDRHGFRARGRARFLMGNVVLHFLPKRRAQPYVLAGPGLVRYTNQLLDDTSTGFALNVGLGVRTHVTQRFFLCPEVRLFLGTPGRRVVDNLQVVTVSFGGGFAW